MTKPSNKKTLIVIIIPFFLLFIIGGGLWKTFYKRNVPFRYQPTYAHSFVSNDSVFWPATSDFLVIDTEEYMLSSSPIFGLPDAINLFSFGNCSPFMGILSTTPQIRDKDFDITWTLHQDQLTITKISFLYPREEVDKRYPNPESYLKPITEANNKLQQKHNPNRSDKGNWKSASSLFADWYSGILYAKKTGYGFTDSVKTDSIYREGVPVLKLEFQNGILKKQEEMWQVKKKNDLPPPPNPFEQDTSR